MNRIFAWVWSQTRQAWVVVSELAQRRRKAPGGRRRNAGLISRAAQVSVLLLGVAEAHAQTVITNTGSQQNLNSSSNYVINDGTTVQVSGSQNTIVVTGISPLTFTNRGKIIGSTTGSYVAIAINTPGTLVNETTGTIYGNTYGATFGGSGSNENLINRGDISVLSSHPVFYGGSASGTVDNYGTFNGGVAGTVGSSANGMTLNTTGTVTVNNFAGASIKSGTGNSTYGTGIENSSAGTYVVNNAGLIQGYHAAIASYVEGSRFEVNNQAGGSLIGNLMPAVRLGSNSTVRNAGSISGAGGAIGFTGSNNTVILESTSNITGTVLGGTNGTLALGGTTAGTFNLANIGAAQQYRNFSTFDKRETGTWTLTGSGAQTWNVSNGRLILASGASLSGAAVNILAGGTFQYGNGGSGGSVSGAFNNNGNLIFNRGDATVYGAVISGSGSLTQSGPGQLTFTADNTYTGTTTIDSGAVLQLGQGGTTGGLASLSIVDNGQLIFNRSDAVTFAGSVSGSGSFFHSGAGALTLTGTNTYTGGTTIGTGGTLQVGAGGATGSIVGDVLNNGTLIANRSGDLLFGGVISGSGTLIKRGSGTLQLTGDNSFIGPTRFEQGVLSATSASNFGEPGNTLIFDGGTLRWLYSFFIGRPAELLAGGGTLDTNGQNVEWRSATTGVGGLTKTGAGTLSLTQGNTYTGGTTVLDGNLQIGMGGTTGSLLGNIDNRASVTFNRSNNLTFGQLISGSGSVTQQGPGTLLFTSNQTYTGGTTISSGTLQLGNGGTSGAVTGNVLNNGALIINRSDNVSDAAGLISGTGTVTQLGSGTLTFNRNHTYAGQTLITSGTLRLGSGGITGAVAGNIVNHATLIHDRSDVVSYAGSLSGTGSFLKNGSGTLILSNSNPFSGSTQVNAGKLWVDGSLGGNVGVASGATLGGVGSLSGLVTIANGGHLAPGDSPGTITLGSLVLNDSSQLDYELGLPNVVGGGVNDLTSVTGNLTLDGVLNITDVGGFGNGVYRLFDYGGTLTDNGLLFGASPSGFGASDFLLQTSVLHQINLIVSQGGLSIQFWDGPNEVGNGAIDGGTSVWNTINTRWTNADGAVNAPWQSGFAVFQGSAGTVTLGENVTLTGAQFISDGYVIDGAGFTLRSNNNQLPVRVNPGATATINAVIADSGTPTQLIKRDTGTLVLGGANTYSGGTSVEGGKLQIAGDANLGAASGAVTLDSGTLITTSSFGTARGLTLGDSGGALAPTAGTTLSWNGLISGSGLLDKQDAGTLVLTADNTHTGGTRLTGTLQLGNGGGTGSVSGDIANNGSLVINRNNGLTLAGLISGSGNLVQLGSGTTTLGAANTYAGGTFFNGGVLVAASDDRLGASSGALNFNGGVLRTGAGFDSARAVTLNAGGGTIDDAAGTRFAGVFAGAGGLTKTGAGTTTLTGNNTYTGGTTISAGTLQVGQGGTSGSLVGNIADIAALIFNRSDASTFAGIISGTGDVTVLGGGTLTLGGANTYTGANGTQVRGGSTLVVANNGNLGAPNRRVLLDGGSRLRVTSTFTLARDVQLDASDGANAIDTGGNTLTATGILSGAGGLRKEGAGALVLTRENTYSGGTTIDAGTLYVGDGGASGSLVGNIVDNGALTFNRVDALTFAGLVSGSGTLTQMGAGTLTLTADNTYTGLTVISGGTLQLGNGGTSGSIVGNITDNARLIFNRSDAVTYTGNINGIGTLTQQGGGILTLTGTHTYGGLTTVAAGTLRVGGSISGAAQVNNGATLGGGGGIGGAVTVADGGHLAPGASPGTLTLGSLTLNSGSILDYELGMPNVVGGGVNDLTSIGGNLTLDGTLNVSDLGGFGNGVYRLFDYGGTLTDNGLLFGALPSGFSTADVLLQTSTLHQINLIVTAGGFDLQFWDGPNTAANGAIDGGTSVWDLTSTRWTNAAGDANATWQRGFAVFQGAAGTVTLAQDTDFTGAQFRSDGYTVEGNGFSLLGATPDTVLRVDPAVTATLNAALTDGAGGPVRLLKTDFGTLVLTAANSHSGGTAVDGGVLQIGADAALGAAGTALSIDNGQLSTTATFTSARSVTLGDDGGAFAPTVGTTLNLSGVIDGAGELEKRDAGTLVLSGANTYSGGTRLSAGTLAASGDGNLGAATGSLDFDGGVLRLDASFNLAATRAVTLDAGGGSVDTNGQSSTWAQAIQGVGALTKLGAGTLVLSGNNLYTGGTAINAGTLQVGAGGASGAVLGDIGNNGALVFARGGTLIYSGIVSGSGSVTQQGPGTLVFTGDHGYSGGTTIAAGTLQLGDNTASGSVTGDILDNGALVFARSDDVTYAGVVSGRGSVTQNGPGALTFTGNHTYTGGTTIASGAVLNLGAGGASGGIVGDVANAGTLVFNRSDNLSFSGNVSGSGQLQKLGAGELLWLGNLSETGPTTISAGTLRVGNGGTAGTLTGDIVNNATLVFQRSDTYHQGSAISGSGLLEQRGPGTLVLARNNTYSGGTLISAGTLQVGNGLSGSIAGNVVDNSALVFNRNDDIVFGGVISGSGTLTKSGAGKLTLDGANTYSGLTTVASGILQVDGSLAGAATVASDATLAGAGSLAGLVTIADGAHLAPGDSPGTLTVGSLLLNNDSQLDYELGTPNVVGGGVNDLVSVTGDLTLDGVLNITDVGGFGNGVYRLFDYGGTFTDNGLLFGTLPSGFVNGDLLLQTAVVNQVNLIVTQGGLDIQFWDGPNEVGNGVIDGGTSTWNDDNARWTNASGTVNAPWQGGFAVFGGTAGTVTLGETVLATGLQFITDGYQVVGGSSILTQDPNFVVRVDPGATATLSVGIADGGTPTTLIKRDAGTLVIGSTTAYSGGTRIEGGTLGVANDSSLGALTGGLTLDGGTLFSNSLISARSVALESNGGTFTTNANMRLNGVISGAGGLTKNGTGTLLLTADNTYGGGTAIASGTLQLGSGGASGSVTGDIANNGALVIDRNNALAIDGIISGSGSVTNNGSGVTSLDAANTYSGGTFLNGGVLHALADNRLGAASGALTFNGGTLRVGVGFDSSRAITLNAGGGVIENPGGAALHGVIGGAGGLTKRGAGTLALTADNVYAGLTTIDAGALQLGDGGNSGSVAGNIVDNGALIFNRSDAYAYNGAIGGTGDVTVLGGGTLTLGGANSYSGVNGTQVRGGSTLVVAGNGNLGAATTRVLLANASTLRLTSSFSLTRDVVLESAGTFARIDTLGNTVTMTNPISGDAGLRKLGAGSLVLSADNSYTGGTEVAAGTLQIGAGGASGSVLGNILNAGVVSFNRSDTSTYAGWISGTGSVSQTGSGTTIFTGDHSYLGGTTISAGTLQIGDGGSSGRVIGNIVDNAALIFNRSDAVVHAGVISGSGTLAQNGSGLLTLGGANTFSGLSTVNAGALRVTGSLAGGAQVNSGATLGGSGSIGGAVNIANGGRLSPGTSPGTLTVGSLVLGATSLLDYELGLPNVVGGGVNDLTTVGGNLTLDGTLNITDLGGFGNGVYRLFNYGGTLIDNGLIFGSLPSGFLSSELLVQTSIVNQINLIVTQGGFGLQFWDGPNLTGNGAIDGGTALWNATDTRWTNADGTVNASWQSGFAVFQGAAGTVTLGQTVDITGAQFRTDGYVVDGGAFNVRGTQADTVLRVDEGVTATFNAALVDGGVATRLVKTDLGTLVLGGANTYSGGTWVSDGAVSIASDAAFGATGGGVTLDGATLISRADVGSARAFDLLNEGGAFAPVAGTTLTLSGVISGAGTLVKTDAGVLALSGINTYSGGTRVQAGVLAIGADAQLGDVAGGLTLDGGTLRLDGNVSLPAARGFQVGAGGGSIDTGTFDSTLAMAVQGVGGLTKLGTGRLQLTGENAYAGGTTISAGTLQVGNGGTSGTLPGDVLNHGILSFARSDVLTYGGHVSGSGSLIQQGPGTLVLTADHSYSGGTSITAGATLQLGNHSTAGSVTGNIVDDGHLVFARSDALTYAGIVSGLGDVRQQGPGVLTFTGNHNYAGGTLIDGGATLKLGAGGTSGSVIGNIASAGHLIFERSDDVSFAGNITGSGRLTQQGTGMLTLLGSVDEAGPTTISSGTLRIGNGGTLGALTGDIANHGALVFHRSDAITQAGTISGSGSLEQRGGGTLLLTAANTYSGGTLISAGTLQVGSGLSGSIVGNVSNQGALVFGRSDAIVFNGIVSGAGTLTQAGTGTLTLSGANTYTGLTTVAAGRLQVDGSLAGDALVQDGTTLGGYGSIAGLVTVANGGHIAPGDSPGTLSVGSLLLNSGSILDYELGLAGVVGGGVNDLIEVAGNLTLDGTLNVSNLGGFGNGVYRLMNYGGTLTDNGLSLGVLPTGILGRDALVQTSIDTEVNLVINRGGFALQFWDGENSVGNGSIDGGSAIWDNSQTHWTGVSGDTNVNWQSGFAVFGATPGTVTLGDDVSISGMQFRSGGYRIEGAGFSIAADAADTIVRVDVRGTAQIDAAIVDGAGGSARLIQRDKGLLILNGANTYSGGTLVGGGFLQIANDGNLGAAGTLLELDGGTLTTTASFATDRPLTLDAGHGVLNTAAGTTLTWNGVVAGVGGLSKTGAGTLVLNADNTYSVGTFIGAGVLQASRDANLGAADAGLLMGGGTLRWGADFDLAASRAVVVSGVGTFDTQEHTGRIASAITGDGALIKQGAGTLILTGENEYAGGTGVAAGTLRIGDGGTTGSVRGDIENLGTVEFARADNVDFAGTIVGSGALVQSGPGRLTLIANHGYTGGTTIAGGQLMLGQGGSTGSVLGNIANNGALLFNRSNDVLYEGVISGSGSLTKLQNNTLVLSADHTYTGGTTISAGQLRLGNGGTTGSVQGDVANEGELAFFRGGSLNFAGAISGGGSVRQLGSGVVTLSGANSYSGGSFLDGGTLAIASDGALGASQGEVTFNGGTLRLTSSFDSARTMHIDAGNGAIETQGSRNKLTGLIDGSGTLVKLGDGVLVLNQGGNLAGGTRILAGTLVVGDSAHPQAVLRDGAVGVASGAALGGYGTVIGAVLNEGLIGIGNALPALAQEPDAVFTLVGTLRNRGTVSMLNGVAADQLLIKQGVFLADGGVVQLETVLNGGDLNTISDQLVTDGVQRFEGGVTGLAVTAVGGAGQVTDGDGIRVVDVAPGGISEAGAFALTQRVVGGSHEYLLFQGSLSNPADGDWYLRSESAQPAPLPILRPEVGAFLGNRFLAERLMVHTLHQRQAEPDPSLDSDDEARGPVWANVSGFTADTRSADALVALHSNSWRLQAGVDALRRHTDGGGVWRAGGFVQYGEADTDAQAVENPHSARGRVQGYGVGVYASWLGDPQRQLGAYVDGWLQYGRFDNRVHGDGRFQANYDSRGWSASLEAGYGVALGRRVVLEPQLQYVRLHLDTDSLLDSSRTWIRDTSRSDWVARMGMRLYGVPDRPAGFSPFVEVNWWRRAGNASMQFNADRMDHYVPRDMTTLDVGVQGKVAKGWQVWLRLGSDLSESSYRELNGTAGVSYQW